MAKMNFGGVIEEVVTREEFPLEKAREILKDETIAVIGYGVQGPGQACNLRDNGFNVIVGQRQGKTFEKAIGDGWVPGETLFSIEEAADKGTIVMCLLSDAAVMSVWPTLQKYLTPGKALYFSHGFAITWNDRTGCVPSKDIDVIMVAPKGSGTSLRTMFLEGRGLNSSYAVYNDATGRALDWFPRFHDAIKPVVEQLYASVKCGNEAQISIDANSKPDYRVGLEKELAALHDSEMWRTAETVRKLRPENN